MALTKKQRANKINKIKRINERRTEIERAVASNKLPKEYLDQYEAAMRSAVHDNSLFSAKGNISHGKRAVDTLNSKALDALLKKETAGTAVNKTYKYYQKYREDLDQLFRNGSRIRNKRSVSCLLKGLIENKDQGRQQSYAAYNSEDNALSHYNTQISSQCESHEAQCYKARYSRD